MLIDELLSRIESPELSATVNVVSGLRSFLRALDRLPEPQALLKALARSDAQVAVYARLRSLLLQDTDPRYEHPADVPVAICLWALGQRCPSLARLCVSGLLARPTFWWARKVAEQLLEQPPTWVRVEEAAPNVAVAADQRVEFLPPTSQWFSRLSVPKLDTGRQAVSACLVRGAT